MTAGLAVDPDIGSAALVLSTVPEKGPSLLEVGALHAVKLGLIGQDEADEASRTHRAAGMAGYAFAAVTVFGFLLRKPA